MKPKFETAVILGDTHGKHVDPEAFDCALQVIKDINPDSIYHNGDVGDFESVSHWLNNKKLRKEGLRLRDDIEDAQNILHRISSVVSKKCTKHVIIGNHDGWVTEYCEERPEVAKDYDLMKEYSIDGWKVYPENSKLNLGKLVVMHSLPKISGEFHTKTTVMRMGSSCIYGHTHDRQYYSLVQYRGKHSGQTAGCLCKLDLDYLEGNPTRWSHGFIVVYLHKHTGYFTAYYVEITNGNTVWNGKFYSGLRSSK